MMGREVSYTVSSVKLALWDLITDPVYIAVIPIVVVAYVYYVTRGAGRKWSMKARILLGVYLAFMVIVLPVLVSGIKTYGFWVEGREIHISTMGYDGSVDLCVSRIELVNIKDAWENITLRIFGRGGPGDKYGLFRLRDGGTAVVLDIGDEDKAIIIKYDKRVWLISVPGVEEYYEKLIRYRSTVCR